MRNLGRGYLQHARRHGPVSDNVTWPIQPVILPLSGIGNEGPFNTQDSLPPPDNWDTVIDSTRRNNFKLTYTGSGTGTLIWPFTAGPGNYTLWIDGGGSGSLTAYFAGSYPVQTTPGPPPIGSPDWLLQSSWTLAATFPPYLRQIEDFCVNTGGSTSGVVLLVAATLPDNSQASRPGSDNLMLDTASAIGNLYQLSTAINVGGVAGKVDGGPGYYFFRLDVTPDFEISEAILQYNAL